jgi:hypothetical protein
LEEAIMPVLCERWKALLINLATAPDDPELARLSPEEADNLRAHVVSCETCAEDAIEEVFKTLPAQRMMEADLELGVFLSGIDISVDLDDSVNAALHDAVDSMDKQLEDTVAGFIARHPELDFERFTLPSARLLPLVAFRTAEAMAMLLRGYHERHEEPCSFRMRSDGTCEPIGRSSAIPASTIVNEIGRWLWESPWESYRPTSPDLKPEENWSEYQSFRQLNRDEHGKDVIVPRLIAWLFAALKVSPGLLYGYRARPSDSGDAWILVPFTKGEWHDNNGDKAKAWML